MAALEFDVRLHMEQLQKDITAVNRKIDDFVQNTKKGAGEIDDQFRKVAGLVAGYFSLNFAANMVKQIALVRGEFQQLEVAFRTMLGSKAKADALMQEVVQFAAITPFELKDVASGAKSLLAFGVAAEDVIPTLKSLGDVSAGLSVPIERLILNFGQVKTQAKLTGRELRDFNVAGVPIIAELAKNLGVAEKEIAAMVEVGNIGFEDVAKAFKTMTDEGGRFSNLMFEQSKTITGQISNLKDEWAMMLNEIGKNNEGAISGALNISKSMVDNYEKVIDVLKILVATYGAYKTAVILTAVAQKAAGIAEMVKQFNNLRKGIDAARAAQTAFNTTASANPYGLALAGIALLVTAITTLVSRAKDVQRYVDEMADSVDELGKQAAIDELVRKYELLSANTEKTKEEQEELKEITKQLGSTFGNAITEVDEYGRAVELSSEKLKEQNDLLLEIKMNKAEIALAEADEKAVKLLEKQRKLIDEINSGYENNPLTGKLGEGKIWEIGEYGVKLRTQELEEVTNQLDELQDQASEAREKIADITGLNVQEQLAPYKELFQEVSKLGADEAISIKSRLLSLITASTSPEILAAITKQVEKLDSAFDPNTVGERRKQTRERLEEERELYRELSKESSRATDEQIEKQREKVEALEKSLGISKNAYKKALDEQKKLEEERLKAQQELSDRLIELENQTQAAQIAIMQDGTAKQVAESRLQRDLELQEIEKSRKEIASLLSKSGLVQGTDAYTAQETRYNDQLNAQAEIAKQAHLNRIERLEADSAEKIKAIWDEVTSAFQTNKEREITAINEKYQKMITEAMNAKNLILATDLESARKKLIDEVEVNEKMQVINLDEEIAMRRLELAKKTDLDEIRIEKEKNDTLKKFALQRIETLKKSTDEAAKQEIKLLEIYISELDEKYGKIAAGTISRISEAFNTVGNAVREVNEELGDMFVTMSDFSNILLDFAGGNVIGGIAGIISTAVGWYKQTITTEEELLAIREQSRQLAQDLNEAYKERIDLYVRLGLLSPEEGILQGEENLMQKLKQDQEKLIDYNHHFLQQINGQNRKVTASFYDMMQSVYGMDWTSKNLKEALDDLNAFEEKYAELNGLIIYTNLRLNKLPWLDKQERIDFVNDTNQILSTFDEINKTTDESRDKRLGFNSDAIADSIVEGLRQGYDSAEDFAKNFEDLLKDAIYEAILTQIASSDVLDKFYKKLYEYSKDGLTNEEINDLQNNSEYGWNAVVQTSQNISDGLQAISGMDFGFGASGEGGYANAIRGITEETAGLIAGQFYAMRENLKNVHMTGLQQLDVANNSLSHLSNIDNNTLLSYIKIEELYEETKRMHTSIKAL
jgi:tape measure domain-containing protein